MKKPSLLTSILFFLLSITVQINMNGQEIKKDKINLYEEWQAQWISHPEINGKEYGVYLFRKSFELSDKPQQYLVHISADNRYKLYVNGEYITFGPARGDQNNWRYESIDLAPYLKTGSNILATEVWNFAEYRPMAQHTARTGLIVQGDSENEKQINTDSTWVVQQSQAYSPTTVNLQAYHVVGPGERFDAVKYPWNWMVSDSGQNFVPAVTMGSGRPTMSLKNWGGIPAHVLVPREIPLMEETEAQFKSIRKSTIQVADGLLRGSGNLTIAPNQNVSILVDQGYLTNAYPVMHFSGGNGSSIKLTYAESLYANDGLKHNRNEIEGKTIKGNYDLILPDGGENRRYETLWWRTFRYVQLDIETADAPLVLEDFHNRFTGYPFEEKAIFKTDQELLEDIWEVGWRTQRLCSAENFFDCPYYEQLQYAGDTRIQCLVSAYVSGDTKLFKNALEAFRDSQMPFGLTQSRYPSYDPQIIPTFSLVWITMIHDYWMLTGDKKTVSTMIPGITGVLQWYESHLDKSKLLGKMEYWNFVDWIYEEGWAHGAPPGVRDGNSALISLQLVYTLQKAAELMDAYAMPDVAGQYRELGKEIKQAVRENCWDESRQLFADTPEKQYFSQHTNVLAILTDSADKENQQMLMSNLLADEEIRKTTYYFSFYLFEALKKVGKGDEFIQLLQPWEEMLDMGLTTFAERPEPTRSDCHAWSASPLYYFLSLVAGITPAEQGFSKVRIAPHFNSLKTINASVPHHLGAITVNLNQDRNGNPKGRINLPDGLTGSFLWKDQEIVLASGTTEIEFRK